MTGGIRFQQVDLSDIGEGQVLTKSGDTVIGTDPGTGSVSDVTATAPLNSTGGNTPNLTIDPATAIAAGSMSAADKTKLDGLSATPVDSVSGTAPIVSSGGQTPAVSITAATTIAAGSMSAADKSKLDGITPGAAVASVSGTAPIVSSGGTTPAVSITAATSGAAGSMSAADKTKLDGLSSTPVNSVSGTAPIVSSGGQTPAVSITAATTGAAGSMSAADKTKLDGIPSTTVTTTGAAQTLDYSAAAIANKYRVNWSANLTLTLIFPTGDQPCQAVLEVTGVGGWSLAFATAIKWAGGVAPTLTTTPGAINTLTFTPYTDIGSTRRWLGQWAPGYA